MSAPQDMVIGHDEAGSYQEAGAECAPDLDKGHAAAYGDGQLEKRKVDQVAGADSALLGAICWTVSGLSFGERFS